jgi:hypothetical protein
MLFNIAYSIFILGVGIITTAAFHCLISEIVAAFKNTSSDKITIIIITILITAWFFSAFYLAYYILI